MNTVHKGKDPETGLDLYEAARKTSLRPTPEFERKKLATHAVDVGFICDHGCAYCMARASIRTHQVFKEIGRSAFKPGYAIVDPGVGERLRQAAIPLTEQNVVMFCSLSDGWAPSVRRYGVGRSCLEYLLQDTPAQVRILTKNSHVRDEFPLLEQYRERVMVGITITGLPEHEAAIWSRQPESVPFGSRKVYHPAA
jgi:DNA repair photolyase